MRKAQVDLTDKEFEEMHFARFTRNWTVQRLLRRALLYFIRTNPDQHEVEKVLKTETETKEKLDE